MTLITRIFYYLYRLFNTIKFLGIFNTLKIIYFSKFSKSKIIDIALFNNNIIQSNNFHNMKTIS